MVGVIMPYGVTVTVIALHGVVVVAPHVVLQSWPLCCIVLQSW